ncbi:hypothetical protein ACJXWG_004504 [Vibrio parahaemolyticus]|nr:hypothetical protein [Vibrio parahaemolyticus]
MSDDIRQKMYDELRDELYKRELSNSESFDKAILSLSSAGLAISLTFIKSIASIDSAIFVYWLYASWVCFGVAIISTVLSLMSSQRGMKRQLELAERYYIEGDEQAFDEPNIYAKMTEVLNLVSGTLFIGAIVAVIVFSVANFNNKYLISNSEVNGMSGEKKELATNGQSVPKMQKVSFKDGASVPAMQKVPKQSQGDSGKANTDSGK